MVGQQGASSAVNRAAISTERVSHSVAAGDPQTPTADHRAAAADRTDARRETAAGRRGDGAVTGRRDRQTRPNRFKRAPAIA